MLSPRIKVNDTRTIIYPDCGNIDEAVTILRENWVAGALATFVVDTETRNPIYFWKRDADVNKVIQGYYAFDGRRYHVKEGRWRLFVNTGSDYHDRTTIASIIKSSGEITYTSSRHAKLVASAILADPYSRQCEYGIITKRCARCGRKLEDPTSRAIGMGPICREKM